MADADGATQGWNQPRTSSSLARSALSSDSAIRRPTVARYDQRVRSRTLSRAPDRRAAGWAGLPKFTAEAADIAPIAFRRNLRGPAHPMWQSRQPGYGPRDGARAGDLSSFRFGRGKVAAAAAVANRRTRACNAG